MAKKNDSLGDRMKGYEGVSRNFLTRRVPAQSSDLTVRRSTPSRRA